MGHTAASVAGRVLVLEKETKLQDKRITALEMSTATILQSTARTETSVKALVRSNNGTKANGKKPKRMEILTGVIVALVGLQSLGVIEGLRTAIVGWLSGGG